MKKLLLFTLLFSAIFAPAVACNQLPILAPQCKLDNALIEAIKDNDIDQVRWLVNGGADVNAKQADSWMTPLMCAIEYGSTEIYRTLEMMPPIHVTYMEEMVRMLLGAGADVNIQNMMGQTALVIAAQNSLAIPLKVFDLLLSAGAEIDAEDNQRLTALDYATKNNDTKLIKLLEKACKN